MPAEEYTRQPKKYVSGFAGEAMDDSELIHLKPRRDPELMRARQPQLIGAKGACCCVAASVRMC